MPLEMMRLRDATEGPYRVHSLVIAPDADPMAGDVSGDPARSLWNGGMLLTSVILGPLCFTIGAFRIFLLLLAVTMCTGHSVGFHRRLIHRTFKCQKWLERVLVWSGTLVGMHGPFWVIRSHDIRDWAQRQRQCHPFLRHSGGFLLDGWWNLHCRLKLIQAPAFDPGRGVGDDWFYVFTPANLDAPAAPRRDRSIRARRMALGRLGCVCSRDSRRVHALVCWLPVPHLRTADLASR